MADQDLDFNWFQANKKSLYLTYPEKFLVISNKEIRSADDNFNDALQQALKSMKAGEFIIQQCTKEDLVCHYSNTAVVFA